MLLVDQDIPFDLRDHRRHHEHGSPAFVIPNVAEGDVWLTNAGLPLLMVPSVVAQVERNVLIDPEHSDCAGRTAVVSVRWDTRL